MATARNDNYTSPVGEPVYIGFGTIEDTPLGVIASALTSGQSDTLITENLNTLDSEGRTVLEGSNNDPGMDWCFDVPYDPVLGIAIGAGGPNGSTFAESILTKYNVFSNRWDVIRDPYSGDYLTHFYSSNAVDFRKHIAYKMPRVTSGPINSYNLLTGELLKNVFPLPPNNLGGTAADYNAVHSITFMPDLGAEGSIIHANNSLGRINRLDIATEVWTNLASGLNFANSSSTAHFNHYTGQAVITGALSSFVVAIVNTDGTVTIADSLPSDIYSSSNFIAHPSAEKSVLYSIDGTIYTLDYLTGSWDAGVTSTGDLALILTNPAVFPFTIPELGVSVFASYQHDGGSSVVVYKL